MSNEEGHVETEILDAVAAAAEALSGGEHTDGTMEQHGMAVDHLQPVHNPVQDHEDHPEAVGEEAIKEEQLPPTHHEQQPPVQQHGDHSEQHRHPQNAQDALSMTLEELTASLHEPPIEFDPNDSASMINAIKSLQHTQRQQTQIILSMRETIHDMQVAQQSKSAEDTTANAHTGDAATRIKSSVAKQWLKPSGRGRTSQFAAKYQTELITTQLQALPDQTSNTTDEHIDSIIYNKKNGEIPCWPVHRLKKWIEDDDLQKVRLHRSMKHTHVPIRIPRTDKNKEGRLICKLCSGGKCNRNTTWMCSTCEVPLCVDTVDGDATLTHHVLWHQCVDLREEHERCNTLLRERRIEKKRGGGNRGEEESNKRARLMDGMLHQGMHEGHVQLHEEQQEIHHEGNGTDIHGEEHVVQHHGQVVDLEPVNVHAGSQDV